MADNTYAVVPTFPAGCLLPQLKKEMDAVWPGDVFPITMIYRGIPGTGGLITVGAITIVTQRVLTAPEDAAAVAHFAVHIPILDALGGVLAVNLAAGVYQGDMAYVSDEPRLGGGLGVIAYWDGNDRTWRRIRDDVAVAVIP